MVRTEFASSNLYFPGGNTVMNVCANYCSVSNDSFTLTDSGLSRWFQGIEIAGAATCEDN